MPPVTVKMTRGRRREPRFPERTNGGIQRFGNGRIAEDLTLGIAVRKARRAMGDFREGARVLVPLKHVRQNADRLRLP